MMTQAATHLTSGKGHRDENFPVASWLIAPRHRAPILAFYQFARTADDIADHAEASAADKQAHLAAMRATLEGSSNASAPALALRQICDGHGLPRQHGLDLLTAFERDIMVNRHADWGALMDYCRYSAMPVGRFVLDVHGESHACWPANDALCAALQIINHLQDCGKDRRMMDRVYLPLDLLARHQANLTDLDAPLASPALRAVIAEMAENSLTLLDQAAEFSAMIRDHRLAAEVAVIHRLARSLARRLCRRDPLSQRVHHHKWEAAAIAIPAALTGLLRRKP